MFCRSLNGERRLARRAGRRQRSVALFGAAAVCWAVGGAAQAPALATDAQQAQNQQVAEPISPVPLELALDPKRVALGERLFYDARLSGDNTRSCAACHPLDKGAMDGRARATATDGQARLRNTPTLFNVGLNTSFNWDGATNTLEAHADKLLANPEVMNATWPALLARLRADADYRAAFATAYSDGMTQANVLNAIADFERSLITPNARFDRFLRGETTALTAEEKQGYELFKSYGCIACHQGVNVGGNLFQKFGVFKNPDAEQGHTGEPDPGRYAVTKVDRDRGVFRVPSLRNVALSAPYFHDGRMPALAGAVDTMARVQLGRSLSGQEVGAIVRFLHTLTGEFRGQRPPAAVTPETP
jgi:cytochrome c peroxidase